MPNYEYTAREKGGQATRGTIFADSEAHLRQVLRESGLYLTRFRAGASAAERRQSSLLLQRRRVRINDLVVMSRQLATLVRAGLTIVEALGTVAAQSENALLSETLLEVRLDVLGGNSLAGAMASHPKVFSDLYVSLVEAGEAAGTLDITLDVAAHQFDKEAALRETVKSALVYPKLVVVACFGVVAFMLAFVVPAFSKVYANFGHELPPITQLLIDISDGFVRFGWIAAIVIALGVWSFKRYYATPGGKHRVDGGILRLWVVGPLARKVAIARFAQTWSGASKGGIPILKALSVAAATAGNSVIRRAIESVSVQVEEGSPVAAPLDQSGQFPPLVTRMIAAGERSGNLDEMLDELTKFYERDVEHGVNRLTKLLEPAMTVVVGGIVLFVLLALYMPAFSLGDVIKR